MITIKIADHVLSIENACRHTETLFRDYRSPEAPEFTLSVSPEEIRVERLVGAQESLPRQESLAIYRKICEALLADDILLFHSSAPVAAIVLLRQGPENTILPLSPGEAFPRLLGQAYRPRDREKLSRTLSLVQRLNLLPVFSLECTISPSAAELVYATLSREGIL